MNEPDILTSIRREQDVKEYWKTVDLKAHVTSKIQRNNWSCLIWHFLDYRKHFLIDYFIIYTFLRIDHWTVFRIFEPLLQPVHTGGGPYGDRAWNGLPGGVEKVRSTGSRFRANREILSALRSIFWLFEPFLPKIDSMQTMKVDINYHSSISKIMF